MSFEKRAQFALYQTRLKNFLSMNRAVVGFANHAIASVFALNVIAVSLIVLAKLDGLYTSTIYFAFGAGLASLTFGVAYVDQALVVIACKKLVLKAIEPKEVKGSRLARAFSIISFLASLAMFFLGLHHCVLNF